MRAGGKGDAGKERLSGWRAGYITLGSMKRQLFKAVYLGMWAAVTGGVVYFGHAWGVSWWGSLLVAYLLFVFVNGSMAYVWVKRRLESEGKQPPSYLCYLFLPGGIRQRIVVPRVVRIVLGLAIFAGGVAFEFAALVLGPSSTTRVHSVGAVALLVVLAVFGAAFIYVGFRLIVMRENEALLSRARERELNE